MELGSPRFHCPVPSEAEGSGDGSYRVLAGIYFSPLNNYEHSVNISAKTEYACIAVLELAANYETGKPVRIRDIAESNGIPSPFLVQILLQLKSAGMVSSTRGAAGGYQLAKSPDEISLAEVMAVSDGPVAAPVRSTADKPISRALMEAWGEVSDIQRRMLASTSVADLLERVRGYSEHMYYI